MKRICINSPAFTRIYDQLISENKLSDQDFMEFEEELLQDPQKGKVIPGLEGLKKESKMSEMFDLLKEGLEGIIQHQKGKKKLKKRVVEVPEPATQYSANDVKRIRKSLHYSRMY